MGRLYCCFLNFGRPGQRQGQEADLTFREQFHSFHISLASDSQVLTIEQIVPILAMHKFHKRRRRREPLATSVRKIEPCATSRDADLNREG